MLTTVSIRLTSPLLGDQQTRDRVRRFRRHNDKADQLAVNLPYWFWAIQEAARAQKLDLDMDRLRLPTFIRAAQTVLYKRKWTDGRGQQTENFESVRAGAIVTLDLFIASTAERPEQGAAVLDEQGLHDNAMKSLAFVGQHIGISPWGSKYNYGRFVLNRSC